MTEHHETPIPAGRAREVDYAEQLRPEKLLKPKQPLIEEWLLIRVAWTAFAVATAAAIFAAGYIIGITQ